MKCNLIVGGDIFLANQTAFYLGRKNIHAINVQHIVDSAPYLMPGPITSLKP
ncbi:Uncharacterised protein [Mycobacteroides abscessus subsp. abscessus]|nr:Uncharacterised protein [Mycobacteroides abscessus subsp. abscessus]